MAEVPTALLQQSLIMGRNNPPKPAKAAPAKAVTQPVPLTASFAIVVNSGRNGAGSVSTPMRKTIRPPHGEPYSLIFPPGEPVLLSTNYERDAVASMIEAGHMREIVLTADKLRHMLKSLK
ncbi:MAG: hypothetical protein H0T51_16400 [Pirellulales bacterium]|nr:hypothetical protein [Pirellulales bacterium]